MTFQLRPMTLDDIAQVASIEKRVFTSPWSPRTYAYEVTESESSHMVVLAGPPPDMPAQTGLLRLLRALGYANNGRSTVLAYGGLWHLMDEAHISTIASHPDYRRQGYGEACLAAMMRRACVLNAAYIALEVRVTNFGAQQLYKKYGFEVAGIKQRYYLDNFEDAYDMRVMLTDATCRQIDAHFRAVQNRLGFRDTYTEDQRNRV